MPLSIEAIAFFLGMALGDSASAEDPFSIDIEETVRRAQAGDREAVALLYRAYARSIYRYIVCRVPTPHDAEDLTADVFVRMVEALPKYQITGAPFDAWLYRIAASRIADFYRVNVRAIGDELHDTLSSGEAAPEDVLQERQLLDVLRDALAQLSEDQQQILILRFVERKSHEEVSQILGKSVTAVKSIQHRALTRLAELLGSHHKARHYLRGRRDSSS